jgi:hypothetical protein
MTTARLLPPPYSQFYDNSGNPLSGGKVYFYLAGTTTKGKVYKDSLETARHKNPVELDSNGRALIFIEADVSYDVVVRDASGSLIYEQPKVKAPQNISYATTHEAEVGVGTPTSTSLPEDAIITSWTSTGQDIRWGDLASGSQTLTMKSPTLATDGYVYNYYQFVANTMGINDNNDNELLRLNYDSGYAVPYMSVTHYASDGSDIQFTFGVGWYGQRIKLTPKGSGYVYINGFRFPNSNGTSGQKLQTNGSKVLSWV